MIDLWNWIRNSNFIPWKGNWIRNYTENGQYPNTVHDCWYHMIELLPPCITRINQTDNVHPLSQQTPSNSFLVNAKRNVQCNVQCNVNVNAAKIDLFQLFANRIDALRRPYFADWMLFKWPSNWNDDRLFAGFTRSDNQLSSINLIREDAVNLIWKTEICR